jgi:hypothetical protein
MLKLFGLIVLYFVISLVLLFTGSKGFLLAVFVHFLVLFIFSFYRFGLSVVNICVVIFFLLLLSFLLYNFHDYLVFNISDNQPGNRERSMQSDYLFSEFSVFGKGLGAALDSGYSRDYYAYGFELSFHNAFHKFGLVFLLALFWYFWTLAQSLYLIFISKSSLELRIGSFVFGAMLYLIPSYGNPLLFSPTAVLLHVLSLYLLRLIFLKRVNYV